MEKTGVMVVYHNYTKNSSRGHNGEEHVQEYSGPCEQVYNPSLLSFKVQYQLLFLSA